jgi:hypothetical protein
MALSIRNTDDLLIRLRTGAPPAYLLPWSQRPRGNGSVNQGRPVAPVRGIRQAADDPRVRKPFVWGGLKLLGFALMAVRVRLRSAP